MPRSTIFSRNGYLNHLLGFSGLLFILSSFPFVFPFTSSGVKSLAFHFKRDNRVPYRNLITETMTPRSVDDVPTNNDGTDTATAKTTKRLVLVGGGHAHLQVIKGLNHASRPENLDVVLIDMTDHPCYSGMVPSAVAGIYTPDETLVDLKSLSEWSGIEFVKGRVIDIDVNAKVVTIEGNCQLPFDALSIDIGSTSRGLADIPGAKENTIPTRPISELVRRIDVLTDAIKENQNNDNKEVNLVVVGGGAAGIELSMGVLGRWKAIVGEENISVTILNSFDRIFPDETQENQKALNQRLQERGISVVNNAIVSSVDEDSLILESGERLGFTHCIWATGAECHSELTDSLIGHGLAVSEKGWIRVNESLQSLSHPYVFAAGDCCTMELPNGGRSPPKAGVYAVRAGPVLIENLTKFLENCSDDNDLQVQNTSPLKVYEPQEDFMKLIACGDGKALGFRFGIPIYGKWVFELKDAIDRTFMDLFKRENLPELVERQAYDTSQYDACSERPSPLPPNQAAELLQRSDDSVDFQIAWNVLRDMVDDDDYRDRVLKDIALHTSTDETAILQPEAVKVQTL